MTGRSGKFWPRWAKPGALTAVALLLLVALPVATAFALDTGFWSPHKAQTAGKGWSNISYSFALDGRYATASKPAKLLKLKNFNIPGIPGGSTINGVVVTAAGHTVGLQADVALSYNGGASFTAPLPTAFLGSDQTIVLGGPTGTWGRNWTAGDFTNANFVVKLTTAGTSGTISVDQVQVKVYYTPPSTTLIIAPASGVYGGTTSLTATLTSTAGGTPIAGKTVEFYLGGSGIDASGNCTGTHVGSGTTQADGAATLASASLAGISAGNYPYGACASFAGDGTYAATTATSDLNISGAATTLTVAEATGNYGGTVDLSATLTSGGSPLHNEDVTFSLFGNEIGTAKTGVDGVASLSGVSLSGYNAGVSQDIGGSFAGAGSYDPSEGTAQITIRQLSITVKAVTDARMYDGTTSSSGTPTITSGALLPGDTAGFSQSFDTADAGSGKTISPGGAVNDGNSGLNYDVTFVPDTTGEITQAPLTVTADNQSMYVSQPAEPAYTFQYAGFVNGETASVIDLAPTCGVSAPHSAVGTYPIVCSGGLDNDYSFAYTDGTLTVSHLFADVPVSGKEWMEPWVNAFYFAGVTTGCGVNPLIYCPENQVTRAEMAVFLLRAKHGLGYAPPAATHTFSDVPVVGKEWMEPWIDEFYAEGLTTGCGVEPLIFCPENKVTRAEMAVFVLRAIHAPGWAPPTSSGIFADVPVGGKEWMQPWIEEYYTEGITTGCGLSPLVYCPENHTTRAEMAVFIGRAYHLYP